MFPTERLLALLVPFDLGQKKLGDNHLSWLYSIYSAACFYWLHRDFNAQHHFQHEAEYHLSQACLFCPQCKHHSQQFLLGSDSTLYI